MLIKKIEKRKEEEMRRQTCAGGEEKRSWGEKRKIESDIWCFFTKGEEIRRRRRRRKCMFVMK
jgi:hypothetical protein